MRVSWSSADRPACWGCSFRFSGQTALRRVPRAPGEEAGGVKGGDGSAPEDSVTNDLCPRLLHSSFGWALCVQSVCSSACCRGPGGESGSLGTCASQAPHPLLCFSRREAGQKDAGSRHGCCFTHSPVDLPQSLAELGRRSACPRVRG